jgi:hypothetical protein
MCDPVRRGWVASDSRFYTSPVSDLPPLGPYPGPMGAAEVQAPPGSPAPSGSLAATPCSSPAYPVRALASLAGGGWTIRAG